MTRLAIDPVTRVGGHLRVEVDVSNGVVLDAWSSGTMYRGIERILEGRDPRDAWLFAQRICGACGSGHALASARAMERALGLAIPRNARLVRNLLAGSQFVVNHVDHFYRLQALDWVDPAAALRADPGATATIARSMSDRPGSTIAAFSSAKEKLGVLIQSAEAGPFAGGYSGHPAYRVPPELSLLVMAHYLEALDWQRRVLRIQAILGGKSPHPQTYVVGGMALTPAWGGPRRPPSGEHPWEFERSAPSALSPNGLADMATLLGEAKAFVDEVYVPDLLAIAARYPDWAAIGGGHGHCLSFGEFPEDDSNQPALLLPRGRVMGRDLAAIVAVDESGVGETVAHSWYADARGDGTLRHPREGQTSPQYSGPRPPYSSLAGFEKYSWLKAPRYEDDPMEVGPAARMLVAYASGNDAMRSAIDDIVATLDLDGADLAGVLGSTLGRTLARGIEARTVAGRLGAWLDALKSNLASGDLALADITKWDPDTWPQEAAGWSLGETPGGAVGHWSTITGQRVANYQVVDGTTWNASPRDARGRRGALEQALVGTPVADQARPVEILRTVHSFDPCAACAVH